MFRLQQRGLFNNFWHFENIGEPESVIIEQASQNFSLKSFQYTQLSTKWRVLVKKVWKYDCMERSINSFNFQPLKNKTGHWKFQFEILSQIIWPTQINEILGKLVCIPLHIFPTVLWIAKRIISLIFFKKLLVLIYSQIDHSTYNQNCPRWALPLSSAIYHHS